MMDDRVFRAACNRLREQNLLNRENPDQNQNEKATLDAHPLVREYFGRRLQQQYQEAWQQAHAVLYDYFKGVPDREQPDTLNEMEPLFAAIRHGCAAGLHQQALAEVYYPRMADTGSRVDG